MANSAALGRVALVAVLVVAALALLGRVVFAALEARATSLRSRFREDVARAYAPTAPPALVTEADLLHLPPPVAAYLRYAGVVGKPRVEHVSAAFRGRIRAKPDGPWLAFRAQQLNFFGARARVFLPRSQHVRSAGTRVSPLCGGRGNHGSEGAVAFFPGLRAWTRNEHE